MFNGQLAKLGNYCQWVRFSQGNPYADFVFNEVKPQKIYKNYINSVFHTQEEEQFNDYLES